MKTPALAVIACLIGCASGCMSTQPAIALAPVGPRQFPPEPNLGPRGSLIVYSAFEPVSISSDSEQRRHSDYDLRSVDGKLIQRVVNRADALHEEPAVVKLAPGHYSVAARAYGAQRVVIPIVIEEDKTTCVRLDGSEPRGSDRVAASELVSLPDGTPVGWRVRRTD
jgi:hypothetical protein